MSDFKQKSNSFPFADYNSFFSNNYYNYKDNISLDIYYIVDSRIKSTLSYKLNNLRLINWN